MTGSVRSRLLPVVAAGAVAAGVLAGCAADGGGREPSATGSVVVPAAATDQPVGEVAGSSADLTTGLLPADAFGAGARVLPLTPELLAGHAMPVPTLPADVVITPQPCADLLAALHRAPAGLPADHGAHVAAQVAVDGSRVTLQGLAAGPVAAGAVTAVESVVAACSDARIDAPGQGTATLSAVPVDVPALGDDTLALALSADATSADGRRISVSGLVALVRDGDRVLALAAGDAAGGSVDVDEFGDLLQQAFEVQAAALD